MKTSHSHSITCAATNFETAWQHNHCHRSRIERGKGWSPGANSSKLNYHSICTLAVNFDRPLSEQPPFFFGLWSESIHLFSFVFSLSFFFDREAFSVRTAPRFSPVIDNVFVIPQRAAGQREIRSAGKNDDRRKYPAPFPRGKSRREGEGATDEAWLVEN